MICGVRFCIPLNPQRFPTTCMPLSVIFPFLCGSLVVVVVVVVVAVVVAFRTSLLSSQFRPTWSPSLLLPLPLPLPPLTLELIDSYLYAGNTAHENRIIMSQWWWWWWSITKRPRRRRRKDQVKCPTNNTY